MPAKLETSKQRVHGVKKMSESEQDMKKTIIGIFKVIWKILVIASIIFIAQDYARRCAKIDKFLDSQKQEAKQ